MSTTRTRRGLAAIILLSALILAVLGAARPRRLRLERRSAGEASPAASASSGPITVTDGSGATVTLQQPATRIVSLAPANTEIAYAIGAGDKMVAGTSYDDYPEAAKSLPKIGDFANPNVEKIASFQPDLVLAAGGIQDELRSKLEKLGMQVYVVDPKTYDGVMTDITNLGRLTGTDGAGPAGRGHDAEGQGRRAGQGRLALPAGDLPRDLQQAAHDRRRRHVHRRHDRHRRRRRTSAPPPAPASRTSAPRCCSRTTRTSTSRTPAR